MFKSDVENISFNSGCYFDSVFNLLLMFSHSILTGEVNELKSLGRQSFDPFTLRSNTKNKNKNVKIIDELPNKGVKDNNVNELSEKTLEQTAKVTKSKSIKESTPQNNATKKPVARLSFELKSVRIMDEDAANNITKGKKEYMIKVGDGKIAIIKKYDDRLLVRCSTRKNQFFNECNGFLKSRKHHKNVKKPQNL
jgi:hypothetical protein